MASQAESKGKHTAAHDETAGKKAADKNEADANKHTAAKNEADDNKHSADNHEELDSLLSTLDGDITALDADAALGLIDQWYGSLHKAKEPELKEIANTIKELKQLVKGGKATGHEIGEVLIEIGEQTTNFGSDASKELKTPLHKLGKQLTKAGTSLGKAEDKEHIEQIDSLVENLEGDLTKIDTEVALNGIDTWYSLLHKSEDENLKEIANGLKQLKQLLKRSNPKGADIGEVLTRLGEQTQEAAHSAGRGLKGRIQKLGKVLSKVGKSLE